jgi:hypothetical protein
VKRHATPWDDDYGQPRRRIGFVLLLAALAFGGGCVVASLSGCGSSSSTVAKAHGTLSGLTALVDGAAKGIAGWSAGREADIARKAPTPGSGALMLAQHEARMAPVDGAVAAVYAAIGVAASALAVLESDPKANVLGAALAVQAVYFAWLELQAAIEAVRK